MSGPIKRLPKWLDRAGFEADKMMRANRVRSEAGRLRDQADDKTYALGKRVLELSLTGEELHPDLQALVDEINAMLADAIRKDEEAKAINAEQWVEPVAPAAPQAPHAAPAGPARPADPISQRLQAYVDAKNSDFNCPKCGTVIRPNASFCPKCGRKVIR